MELQTVQDRSKAMYTAMGKRIQEAERVSQIYTRNNFTMSHEQIREHSLILSCAIGGIFGLIAWFVYDKQVAVYMAFTIACLSFVVCYFALVIMALKPTETEVNTITFDKQEGSGTQAIIRLEILNDNTMLLRDLPIGINQIFALAEHLEIDGRFSRRKLAKANVCTEHGYDALVQSMIESQLLIKQGKGYEITNLFDQLVCELNN